MLKSIKNQLSAIFLLILLSALTLVSEIVLISNFASTTITTSTSPTTTQYRSATPDRGALAVVAAVKTNSSGGEAPQQCRQQQEGDATKIPCDEKANKTPLVLSQGAAAKEKCWRSCPKRINKIFYGHGVAGLGDRFYIIMQLAQIAGYLCARLELPPPSACLNIQHNHYLHLSSDLIWQDFKNLTFREDNSSVIVDPRLSSFDRNFSNWRKTPLYDEQKYSDWLYIVSDKNSDTLKDYERLQNFSWQQEENSAIGFIWEIRSSYYSSTLNKNQLLDPPLTIQNNSKYSVDMRPKHHVRKKKKDGSQPENKNIRSTATNHIETTNRCNYVQEIVPPSDMVLLMNRIKERILSISLQNATYGYFHIRRSDTIKVCNTTIAEIRNFLQCSLNGTERFGKNITILMGSDETDESYRQSVIGLSDDYSHLQILDADKITHDVLTESIRSGVVNKKLDNNFYIYELQRALRGTVGSQFSSFHLEKRKKVCMKCVRLLGKYPFVE
jgi:hypothetical protein